MASAVANIPDKPKFVVLEHSMTSSGRDMFERREAHVIRTKDARIKVLATISRSIDDDAMTYKMAGYLNGGEKVRMEPKLQNLSRKEFLTEWDKYWVPSLPHEEKMTPSMNLVAELDPVAGGKSGTAHPSLANTKEVGPRASSSKSQTSARRSKRRSGKSGAGVKSPEPLSASEKSGDRKLSRTASAAKSEVKYVSSKITSLGKSMSTRGSQSEKSESKSSRSHSKSKSAVESKRTSRETSKSRSERDKTIRSSKRTKSKSISWVDDKEKSEQDSDESAMEEKRQKLAKALQSKSALPSGDKSTEKDDTESEEEGTEEDEESKESEEKKEGFSNSTTTSSSTDHEVFDISNLHRVTKGGRATSIKTYRVKVERREPGEEVEAEDPSSKDDEYDYESSDLKKSGDFHGSQKSSKTRLQNTELQTTVLSASRSSVSTLGFTQSQQSENAKTIKTVKTLPIPKTRRFNVEQQQETDSGEEEADDQFEMLRKSLREEIRESQKELAVVLGNAIKENAAVNKERIDNLETKFRKELDEAKAEKAGRGPGEGRSSSCQMKSQSQRSGQDFQEINKDDDGNWWTNAKSCSIGSYVGPRMNGNMNPEVALPSLSSFIPPCLSIFGYTAQRGSSKNNYPTILNSSSESDVSGTKIDWLNEYT